tara:strand:+ start:276 stop:461 length:186 start_codon:yes stop_codon:yes gene_type:complete
MITKQECADYINANMSVALTPEEKDTLRNSIVNSKASELLTETLIEVFGDVTMLVEIRDAG